MWDSFWDFIWYTIVIFAFVAYLMILFNVIVDLFRDSETSGWVKAMWILFLVLVPYIALFVYLIARGSGMGRRAVASQQAAQQQADAYIRQAAGTSPADQIATAKALHNDGSITDAEYEQLKVKALSA
ncbi:SHOCT domain-containing protein [Williamsia muralis]|uniref:SHOCT domain-containing protein n=1 Tax=Williamsia marianensis TaxID=85044 RepID=A0ABU4EXC1_WILMA|nr:SHOCT domain-containing protein [Williamsia muralis]MDV7135297.1 SHOCT domain-containing protein [Williamsia muralis]